MYVHPWSKAEPRALARYVTPEAVRHVVLPAAGASAGDFPGLCRAVYEAARALDIGYTLEGYDPRAEIQQIRTPADVAAAPRQGTCLDLAVFYAGLCLGFDLLPYLVVLEDHALVVVSTAFGRRDWDAYARTDRERFAEGLLADPEALRQSVDDGEAIAVECTGFARSSDAAAMGLDTAGRTADGLSFDAAAAAGRSRLDRPFRFALDVAELHYRWQLTPFAAVDPELLAQIVDQLETQFGITPAGGSTLPPVRLRERLAKLFDRHTLFGGRDRELAALDAFVAERPSGYAFVTGRSGFGKSALLVNWIRSLEARGQRVVYHFISRTDGVADQDTTLRSLCQQLTHAHDLRGDLPDSVQELRTLFTRLLGMPARDGIPIIVVLDGLDEADQWDPALGPDLFPTALPGGTHLIFSARDVADRDWLAGLELTAKDVFRLSLTTLGAGEIRGLLRAAGERGVALGDDAAFVAAVLDRSQGDPFYLHYLALDVRDGVLKTTDDVHRQPRGLNAYLDKWWDDVSEAVGERAVSDLLGYLLVAKGPLLRRDLTEISPSDALTGLTFRRTLDMVRRYLVGSDALGYTLCHPRFRDYVAGQLGATERAEYWRSLLAYCGRWQTHRSAYALRFLPAHLTEEGRREDLLQLFTPEWIAATWQELKTYVPLVEALRLATQACLHEPPTFDAIPGLALARQTATELMLGFPPDLLVAWVALGQAERAIQLVDSLGDARGRAADAATAVAEALLRANPRTAEDIAHAGNLLLRAASLLPWRRSTSYVLETLHGLRRCLAGGAGLNEARRREVLAAVERFATECGAAELEVITLGIAAEAWSSTAEGVDEAARLLERAGARLGVVEAATDRLVASAFLVPAMRAIRPEGVAGFMREALAAADPFHGSSLYQDPMVPILDNWRLGDHPDAFGEEALADLCRRCLSGKLDGLQAGRLAKELAAIGRSDLALDFLEKAWLLTAGQAALAVATAVPFIGAPDSKGVRDLFDRAVSASDPSNGIVDSGFHALTRAIAETAARCGRWDLAFATLRRLTGADRMDPLIRCLRSASEIGMNGDALARRSETIAELAGDLDARNRAAVMATAAAVLARAERPEAGAFAARCAGICLGLLPEGDMDGLWRMLAIAEAADGEIERACIAVRRMRWSSSRGRTLATLTGLAGGDRARLLPISHEMSGLIAGERARLYEDGLIAILDALEPFVRDLPSEAEALLDGAWLSIGELRSWWTICRCAGAEIKARVGLNPETAIEHLEMLLAGLEREYTQGRSIGMAEINPVIDAAAVLAPVDTTWAVSIEDRLREMIDTMDEGSGDPSALVRLTAAIDPERGAIELTRCVDDIPRLANGGSSGIETFKRLIAEMSGKRYSSRNQQIQSAGPAAASVAGLAEISPDRAPGVLIRLLETVTGTLDGEDLVDTLVAVIRTLGGDRIQLLGQAAERIALAADSIDDPRDGAERVRRTLATTLAASGDLSAAELVLAGMASGALRENAASVVEIHRRIAALDSLSPLERDFLSGDEPELKRVALIHLRTEGKPEELLHAAATSLIEQTSALERLKLIGTFAPIMLLPAYSSGGPALMRLIVEGLEAWDQRFVEAAQLVGEAE